jgi:hypothetical protein
MPKYEDAGVPADKYTVTTPLQCWVDTQFQGLFVVYQVNR